MACTISRSCGTRAGTLAGIGNINLDTEQIDFLLIPKPEHPDLSLSTNLRVSGTIMDARVGPEKLALLEEGAFALSSLVIGPLGLLAPFVHLARSMRIHAILKVLDSWAYKAPGNSLGISQLFIYIIDIP